MAVLFFVLGALTGSAGGYLIYLTESWQQVGYGSALLILSVMMISTAYMSRSVATL